MVKGGFASTLGLTENKLMLKDEDLYTMYHAETCQVHLHNVKEKRLKFPLTRKHFEIFGGSGKLQGITKKLHLYIKKKSPCTARNLKVLMNNLSISQFQFFYS